MKKSQAFYRSKRTSRKPSLKRKIFGGLFFCLLAGLIYFFVFSPVLRIERIKIEVVSGDSPSGTVLDSRTVPEGLSLIIQEILTEKIWGIIPRQSIVLVPTDKIKTDILENFPKVKSIIVNKHLPNVLEIRIEEREPVGVYCQTGKCFYIDQEGIIFKEAPAMEGGLILNIEDLRNQAAVVKKQVVSPEIMEFILTIRKELPELLSPAGEQISSGANLKAVNFIISSIEDLRVLTSEGWQIYFNPQRSVEAQLEILKRVLEEEIQDSRPGLEYMDLRIENRVYYK
jgi:cell division septal protein FtsQ